MHLNRCLQSCGQVHAGHYHGEGLQTLRGHVYGGHQHFHPGSEKVEPASALTCPPHALDPLGTLATSDPGKIYLAAAF